MPGGEGSRKVVMHAAAVPHHRAGPPTGSESACSSITSNCQTAPCHEGECLQGCMAADDVSAQ